MLTTTSVFTAPTTLRLGTQVLDLDSDPAVMGILNVTPDSFYEGSRSGDRMTLLKQAATMVADGVTLFDVGGYSTRPGAAEVSLEEERDRVLPAIELLRDHFPDVPVSVDTFRAQIAAEAVAAGAVLVNDVSGGRGDADMIPLVAAQQIPYVLMHSRGTPQTMGKLANYQDIVYEVMQELRSTLAKLHKRGHYEVVIDAGFGFAKTGAQNFVLLRRLKEFSVLGCPLLAGVSRKRMVWQTLGVTPDEALNGTTALHAWALTAGARILRVHDVAAARQVITLWQAMQKKQTAEPNIWQ